MQYKQSTSLKIFHEAKLTLQEKTKRSHPGQSPSRLGCLSKHCRKTMECTKPILQHGSKQSAIKPHPHKPKIFQAERLECLLNSAPHICFLFLSSSFSTSLPSSFLTCHSFLVWWWPYRLCRIGRRMLDWVGCCWHSRLGLYRQWIVSLVCSSSISDWNPRLLRVRHLHHSCGCGDNSCKTQEWCLGRK